VLIAAFERVILNFLLLQQELIPKTKKKYNEQKRTPGPRGT